MTQVEHLANFVVNASFSNISGLAMQELKIRVLDSLGCALGALGNDLIMFEAADPDVFAWYIKNYGPEVNLFLDHSQIVQLGAMRRGIWGTKDLWGRVVTFKEETSEKVR